MLQKYFVYRVRSECYKTLLEELKQKEWAILFAIKSSLKIAFAVHF